MSILKVVERIDLEKGTGHIGIGIGYKPVSVNFHPVNQSTRTESTCREESTYKSISSHKFNIV